MNPLLQVDNLEVAFDTKDGLVRAVNGISYSVNEGDTLGIVGESGSGKSVSVMSMLRLLPEPPARIVGGRVLFDDRDLLKMKPQQMYQVRGNQIAIVFQDPMTSLNPVMSVGDQIAEAVQVNTGVGRGQAVAQATELLERVGIPHAAERLRDYPHQFSGGMRQRVMIAIAISCNPRLLIADEPTTALDVTIQAQIVDLVKELQRELGIAVIWITHDLGVIARLAKRVLVMYGGKIVEQGPIKRVFKAPAHPYTIGLLTSRPGIDIDRSQALPYIEGAPPDMIRLPVGCPFTPRCGFRSDRCGQELPPPVEVSAGHLAACWHIDAVRDHVATLSTPSAISLQPR
jgi:oligopeptide transport system ATP-binding protein